MTPSDNQDPLFGAGDIVQLKSGGPRMTVTQVVKTSEGTVEVCLAWFDVHGILHRDTLDEAFLDFVDADGEV